VSATLSACTKATKTAIACAVVPYAFLLIGKIYFALSSVSGWDGWGQGIVAAGALILIVVASTIVGMIAGLVALFSTCRCKKAAGVALAVNLFNVILVMT